MKKAVLKSFAIFAYKSAPFFKRDSNFPVNIAKFLRKLVSKVSKF